MSVELEQQLETYGRWIEHTHSATLRPTTPPPRPVVREAADAQLAEARAADRPTKQRRVVMAAAVVLVIAGVVGAAIAGRPDPPPQFFSAQNDPPGPLYLLPGGSDVVMGSGSAAMLTGVRPGQPSYGATVGRAANGGFEDLATVSTFNDFDTGRGWVEGDHGGFPTWTSEHGFLTMVAQDRGAWWVLVQSGPDRSSAVFEVLDDVVVASTGEISLGPESSRQIVDSVWLGDAQSDTVFAQWTATIPGPLDTQIAVETYSWPDGLGLVGGRFDRVEPTTINGVRAWRAFGTIEAPVSEAGEDALHSTVLWNFSPHRMVVVGGQTDIDTIEAFAATLRQVTAEEWGAAVPEYSIECTLDTFERCNQLPPDPEASNSEPTSDASMPQPTQTNPDPSDADTIVPRAGVVPTDSPTGYSIWSIAGDGTSGMIRPLDPDLIQGSNEITWSVTGSDTVASTADDETIELANGSIGRYQADPAGPQLVTWQQSSGAWVIVTSASDDISRDQFLDVANSFRPINPDDVSSTRARIAAGVRSMFDRAVATTIDEAEIEMYTLAGDPVALCIAPDRCEVALGPIGQIFADDPVAAFTFNNSDGSADHYALLRGSFERLEPSTGVTVTTEETDDGTWVHAHRPGDVPTGNVRVVNPGEDLGDLIGFDL